MKKYLGLGLVLSLLATSGAHAQGTLVFANNSASQVILLGDAAAVLGLPSGSPIPVTLSQQFKAGLYYASGEYAPYSQLANTFFSSMAAGQFNGGAVTIPGIPGGSLVWLQVRVWESAYGDSYEEAVAAAPINGRVTLAGWSNRFQLATGTTFPTPITDAGGLAPIYIMVPEPSTYALGLLGLSAAVCLRFRRQV